MDLALLDVVMPTMSGPEVYDCVRVPHPETKVLFMSGYTQDVISHQGVLKEGIRFSSKPVAAQVLMMKVSRIIGR